MLLKPEPFDYLLRNFQRILIANYFLENARILAADVPRTLLEKIARLASNELQLNFSIFVFLDKFQRGPEHVGIERARQTTIGCDHQQLNALLRPHYQQVDRLAIVPLASSLRHIRQHALDDLRVRTRRQHTVLSAAQLRRRDHFHGLGDLPRVLDRANSPA